MSAEHDRFLILERVAAGIWNAAPEGSVTSWDSAIELSRDDRQTAVVRAVERTRQQAKGAVEALMVGMNTGPEAVRLAMAGEHASGVVGGQCIEIWDAMLGEVLL